MKRTLVSGGGIAALALATAAHAQLQPEWRLYRPTNTGILGDYVGAIFVDDQDLPWIGAYTTFWEQGGMSHMNADGTWTPVSNFDHPQIGSPRFNDIVPGAGTTLWIGTYDGLLRYDTAAGPAALVKYTSANAPIPSGRIYDVDVAPDGTVWCAIFDVTGPGGGLARFNPATNAWSVWTTANGLPWGQQFPNWDNLANVAVVPDAAGPGYTVYFAASTNSLGMGTYRDGVFQSLGNPQSPPPGLYPIMMPGTDLVDDQGNIWLITNQGLARRARSGAYTTVPHPPGMGSGISTLRALDGGRAVVGSYYGDTYLWSGSWAPMGNWGGSHTYAFAEDSTGAIWAGGIGGSAKFENGFWQRYRLTNTGMVGFWIQAIDFAPDGRVFMNGNAGPGVGGFDIFDGTTWTCVNNANAGLGPAWGQPSDNVGALCFRASGTLAVAPAGTQGLRDWDGFTYTTLIPAGWDIIEVDEDSLGRLWAVHYGNGGVSLLTGANRQVFTAQNSQLFAGSIGSVEPDPAGNGFVWITSQFGIVRTNGTTWEQFSRELIGLNQNSLGHMLSAAAPAADGTLWIGSANGLYHFNPTTGAHTRYHTGNSALTSNNIQHVHIAPDGSIWVTTFDGAWPYPGGLTHFDGQTWTTFQQGTSPLPHNQIWELNSREVPGGYELWVGTASEGVAVLTVSAGAPACPADWNGDGAVGTSDISGFLVDWFADVAGGTTTADFDASGVTTTADISAFLSAWFTAVAAGGC
ncbi:MAG TPA: hypothetical protein VD963_11340 [Phycisphaerales bacterium]|nr:hypothetical protein [Phycisphaerales bacterium]